MKGGLGKRGDWGEDQVEEEHEHSVRLRGEIERVKGEERERLTVQSRGEEEREHGRQEGQRVSERHDDERDLLGHVRERESD